MLKIIFFAQVRELVGTEQLALDAEYSTVEDLRKALALRGDKWALSLESGKLLTAVNQSLVSGTYSLNDGDEVAFFPPVTGG